MSTFKTWVEIEVEVTYKFHRGLRSTRDRYGVPEGPDDEDEMEILEIAAVHPKPDAMIEYPKAGTVTRWMRAAARWVLQRFRDPGESNYWDVQEFLTRAQQEQIAQDAWAKLSDSE